ncbi:16170_t:CDS:2 [Gigaspora margarita]|uniref:16170_t:CDS:1 n=1 Tax=Gigaspora margarita TaxID=4874 RepID=A0ABM8VVT3_GIGMA|nr:16170_t:CDS:2 [Gigaspora margarita]
MKEGECSTWSSSIQENPVSQKEDKQEKYSSILAEEKNPKNKSLHQEWIFFSADNRRLFCVQQAILLGANFKKILVQIFRKTNKSLLINWKIKGSYRVIKNENWDSSPILFYCSANGYTTNKNGDSWNKL